MPTTDSPETPPSNPPIPQYTPAETPGSANGALAEDTFFIRVSVAKRRYFGGAMSLRWWYKQVESGRPPHFRAGGAVLLRPSDVEAFIAETFHEKAAEPKEPAAPAPSAPGRRRLRFFQ